ncbi:UbiA family prenyltransferase [Aporhodopirellula aestuarii]|uniref:UbiA family prenyltransferase n=1 Tax=Aporhodopirellula aestuarii TaxID=2950107 RepID=A0ABT0U115_9BACT|nr:UbiA family prenyltransferase [Aporhodopirellula aestuarii]MCM2370548.1 UbiA family prenyltransferase [Aporhodopirellula aestuarii]
MNTANWKSWATLVRLPNVFTVIADVAAAFLLVLGGSGWYTNRLNLGAFPDQGRGVWLALAAALVAGVSLYWAGMILNDVFDLPHDEKNRRNGPLVTGSISLPTAKAAGWGLLLFGILPPLAIGLGSGISIGWLPALVAIALAICIVLYDGPMKRTPVAPVLMGACRTLSFLLGAAASSAAIASGIGTEKLASQQLVALGQPLFLGITPVVLTFAIGMGTYIAGLTTFGRRESIGDRTIHLPIGLVAMTIGAMLLAWAPRVAGIGYDGEGPSWMTAWRVDPVVIFPAAILLMLATTLLRARSATMNPSPERIQATIGSGLLAIIPIAAAITMLAVGAKIAVLIFALMFPSRLLARHFRVT